MRKKFTKKDLKAQYEYGYLAGQQAVIHKLLTKEVIIYDKAKGYGSAVKLAVDTNNIQHLSSIIEFLSHKQEN